MDNIETMHVAKGDSDVIRTGGAKAMAMVNN